MFLRLRGVLWLYILFSLFTLLGISFEAVTYNGFLEKHFFIDLRILFLPIISLGLYFYIYPLKKYPSFFTKLLSLNRLLFLPVATFTMLFFLFLEYSHYPNYVFSTFHIHYDYLFYSFALSSLTFLYFLPKHIWKMHQKNILFITPFLLTGIAFIIRLWPNDTFFVLSREDNVFENFQFVFFASASLLAFIASAQNAQKKRWLYMTFYLLFSLFLFFVSGEEISWGQRILGIQSSEYLKIHNAQQETTVHNFHGLQEYQYIFYLLFSSGLSFSWALIKVFPQKIYRYLEQITPPWYISTFFLPIFLFYAFVNIFTSPYTEWQEFVEMLLASGLFLFLHRSK